MKRLIFVAFSAAALSGCMGSHLKKLPVCDGHHLRAVNIYGSILPSLPVPEPASESEARKAAAEAAAEASSPSAPGAVPSPETPEIKSWPDGGGALGGQLKKQAEARKSSLNERPAWFRSC